MSRFVDRGAIIAAYVGIGMAVTIAMSFLLIIPIEWVVWVLTIPAGLLIGYYANQRSNRRAGPWSRILVNGVFAALVTGLATAAMLLLVKGLFFFADDGYRDAGQGGRIECSTGADCVYQRYLDDGRLDAVFTEQSRQRPADWPVAHDDGTMPAAPYAVQDNPLTWLEQFDLVFIDAWTIAPAPSTFGSLWPGPARSPGSWRSAASATGSRSPRRRARS